MRKRRYKQSGKGVLSAVLPSARAALPFIGKSAASGALSLGAPSLLGKIFGSGRRKKRGRRKRYRRYVR